MKEYSTKVEIDGKIIEVSTGKIGKLARGSVMLKMGGTVLYATASIDNKDTEQDYFPLGVEYIEKYYAAGKLSGSRFDKREGFPSEDAIIKGRQVDHSIRSLFPKSFVKPVSVVLTVLAYDGINDPEALAVFGASLALMQTGAPYMGPCASVIASVGEDNQIILNPTIEQRHHGRAEFVLSAVNGKFLNIEGWAKEIPEELMNSILDKSLEHIEKLNNFQTEFVKESGVFEFETDKEWNDYPADENLIHRIEEKYLDQINTILTSEKTATFSREYELSKLTNEFIEINLEEELNFSEVDKAVNYIARKILRDIVREKRHRITGRGLQEIRPLSAEIDILPTVHGSALFTRGLTQSLSVVTLGPKEDALLLEDMSQSSDKTFMHHYNMPAYANGEAGRFSYKPGRREVGHGAIGENALKNMVPSSDEFPYTIRVVSEITTSNGSTSMAATCASSLALMAAGVPLKEQVAGIGVGLITHEDSKYDLLLDIEGIEDFYGDMDFKVCGTKNGITAIQYENKIRGVEPMILKEAFVLAKNARGQVLEVMNSAISTPRQELSENAPVVHKVKIDSEEVGALIGPSGKNIKGLIADSSVDFSGFEPSIAIEDSGVITITAKNKSQLSFITDKIESMFKKANVGDEFDAVVDKITAFGFFANVSSSISGLCHISEITDGFIKEVDKVLSVGDTVRVKVLKIENGKTSFTMKGLEQPEAIKQKLASLNNKNVDKKN